MLIEEIKNIKSSKKELRKFGITVGIVLGLLGGFLWWKGKDLYLIMFVISFLFLFFGAIVPIILKPIQKVWMSLALILGWIMTRVILSLMFYLVFFPIGMLARIFGKDFLDQKRDTDIKSYWILRKSEPQRPKEAYEKQF
jgi:hypothetical protein